ncbi:hypothetical protein HPP92_001342 [Vanilla planifolia]|uniref:noroxomaritidine synthase n=1 Tax=Vanilla planifolia TaxID=51239 RepID=A0A835S6G4_VANPL|nr:hypothetical protein HPP92_001342 [Vanilla planifolia]
MRGRVEVKTQEDVMSRYVLASEKDATMTDRYPRDIILSFLIAGKDTSANTLTWFFYMLCKNPSVQEKIWAEINFAMGNESCRIVNLQWRMMSYPMASRRDLKKLLGKVFAYRQMKILAATLLHFFVFKLEDERKIATYKTMFTLHMENGLSVIPFPRLN